MITVEDINKCVECLQEQGVPGPYKLRMHSTTAKDLDINGLINEDRGGFYINSEYGRVDIWLPS